MCEEHPLLLGVQLSTAHPQGRGAKKRTQRAGSRIDRDRVAGKRLTPDKVMGAAITGVMAVMAGCS